MRAYWILPNRDQGDDVLASDGERVLPLRQILDPKRRPDGFSHGVPTEILEKYAPSAFSEILFAQRFEWQGGRELFSVSTPAGVDTSGRVVHLGLLFVLERNERPSFELSYAGLPDEDRASAADLVRRMTSATGADPWVESVRDLVELSPDTRPATNVALDRSVVRFHSLYELGPGGLTKKAARRVRSWTTALILLIVVAFVGAWICVQATNCSFALNEGETGDATWHFN
jgi:hypothetical protein